ncbi:MAG: hypothetical protein WD011_07505, partial [Nitriliruptoraceae bacterium]
CGAAAASIAEGARDAGHGDVVEMPSARAAAEWIGGSAPVDAVILVKASRVARLEAVVAHLRDDVATAAAPTSPGARP